MREFFGGRQVGDKGAVVAGDDNSAGTRGNLLDDLVFGTDTILGCGHHHLFCIAVVRDAANVNGRVGREKVLMEESEWECKGKRRLE